tara:strand:- start:618 stop:2753 length:2136 start_codon:yes stop_codon:yes gene_type:complete
MGTQNLNNFYFNKLNAKLNYSSYYDIFLASDEKDFKTDVIWSTNIIDYDDGNKLPVWIDLNTTASTQPNTSCVFQYPTGMTSTTYYTNNNYRPFVVLSNNVWPDAKSMCECPYTGSGFTIGDASWTSLDNGLFNVDDYQNGATIDLFNDLPTSLTYDIFSYDKRFKMHQVKAFGFPWWTDTFYTDTTILDATDYSGYYQELKGGFYQGFYKLYGYPYEVLPTRPKCGWSFETYLKINTICTDTAGPTSPTLPHGVYGNCYNTSGWYLDTAGNGVITPLCSENPSGYQYDTIGPQYTFNYSAWNGSGMTIGRTDKYGFFFYKGVRAEDKWFHEDMSYSAFTACTTFSGEVGCCYECTETGLSGDTCNGQTGFTATLEDPVKLTGENKSPTAEYDVYSNAIGFRITDDMRIGYRTIRYTGSCQTTGETCNTGSSFHCGYTIEESYSEPICAFMTQSGDCTSNWVQVDVVFDRDLCLEECEIHNDGGVNDLVKVRTDKFQRYGRHIGSSTNSFGCRPEPPNQPKPTCKEDYPAFINEAYFDFNCHGAEVQKWFDEKNYRMGTLTFYINGRRVHKVENYEEIIPRQLNTNKQTQVGVAYNMSWGGGAMGLRESLITDMSGCTSECCSAITDSNSSLIHWSGETDQRLIMENFAGSFIGGISQMMYYIKPLTPDEIYHNFLINKSRYKLIDCEECKNCYDGCIDCNIENSSSPPAC